MSEHITVRTRPSRRAWFRELPPTAQHLCMLIELDEDISHAGVMAWSPSRVASWAQDWSVPEVTAALDLLRDRGVVELDEDTGELWLTDRIAGGGSVRSPKLRPAVARAIMRILSPRLRSLAVNVLRRLVSADPIGWAHPDVIAVVDPYPDPAGTVPDTPPDTVSAAASPAVSAPLFNKGKENKPVPSRTSVRPLVPIPADFWPAPSLTSWALRECPDVDIDTATRAFVAHNLAHGNVWPDPDEAWRGWMRQAHRFASVRGKRPVPRRAPVPAGAPTPTPPSAAERVAALTPWSGKASAATRERLRTGWRTVLAGGMVPATT